MPEFNDRGAVRNGASVGAYFRLPLAHQAGKPAKPQIGLRVSAIRDHRNQWSPRAAVHQADALDLRLVGAPKPTLLVAGRPAADLPRRRANLSTGATIAIVAGGAALLLLAAAAAAGPGFPDCPTIGGSRDHCID
jgi:hypothetical protein